MNLTLYTMPRTCALASQIALEEAGADYAKVRVDFKKDEQRQAAYLAINSEGPRAGARNRPGHPD